MSNVTLESESKVYFNFIHSIKSEITRMHYRNALFRFLRHYNLDIDTFVRTSPKDIENLLIDYMVLLRKNKKSLSSLNIITSAVTHFCVMNDISVSNKKVNKFKGENESSGSGNDRGYSTEEIQILLNSSPLRMKMVFLILCSTGIRIGALPILRIKHLNKIEDKGFYQFTIYANSPEHRYVTYCTPECAAVIDSYLQYRERFGEKITPESDSYLLRQDFDITDLEQIRKNGNVPVTVESLRSTVRTYLIKTGLRVPYLEAMQNGKRHEVAQSHGFRKFFETRLIESDLNPMAVLRLVGHKGGLDNKSYFRPKEDFIISEYEKAIDALTIDPANRLRKKVVVLQERNDRLDRVLDRLDKLENELGITK